MSEGRITEKDYVAMQRRAFATEAQLEQANALWRYWRDHDITDDDDHWSEFTNAVHAHLDGKPVPERFTGGKR